MKLIAVGDNIMDCYTDQKTMYPGGNALNVAVFSNRYGAEKSSYVGIIGDDREGSHLKETLEKEAIDISRLRTAVGESGKTNVVLNEKGDRVFGSWNNGGVQSELKLRFNGEDIHFIKQHHLLHSSVYSYLESELPSLSNYVPLSFDFSTKREEEYLKKVCPYLTYAFFSGSDLNKENCLRLTDLAHRLGTKKVLITRGDRSALFSDQTNIYEQPSPPILVTDTLGAGDSFIAMFLTKYHETQHAEQSLFDSAEAASKTCTYFGAFGYGLKDKQQFY